MGMYKDVDLFSEAGTIPEPEVTASSRHPGVGVPPVPPVRAPEVLPPALAKLAPKDLGAIAEHTHDLATKVKLLEAECEKIAWLSAMQSAAANGDLKPFMPYEGKPLAPIEEILRLQRVIELMKGGLSYETSKSTAAQEIPIDYKKRGV